MQTTSYTNSGGIMPVDLTHDPIAPFDDAEPTVVLRIPKQSLRMPTSNA
jgi:hypothetical protein